LHRYGTDGSHDGTERIHVDKDGAAIMTGFFHDEISFGPQPLEEAGLHSFVVKISSQGEHVFSFASDGMWGITSDRELNTVLAGPAHSPLGLDCKTSPPSSELYWYTAFPVVKLGPYGECQWVRLLSNGAVIT